MLVIKTPISFKDKRGVIVDLLEKCNINAITFITLNKGSIRGNHYHKKTTQYNYIMSGEVKLVTQFENNKKKSRILKKGDLVGTVPGEKHALVGIKKAEMLVFTEGPRGGKEYETDTYRLEKSLA